VVDACQRCDSRATIPSPFLLFTVAIKVDSTFLREVKEKGLLLAVDGLPFVETGAENCAPLATFECMLV